LKWKISTGACRYYIARDGGVFVGFVRFDELDHGTEVSVCILPEHRGKKIAVPIIIDAIKKHGEPVDRLFVSIKLQNTVSLATFLQASKLMCEQQSAMIHTMMSGGR
jgi:hypothetical protein